jgi:ribosomal protein S18 acetylase RimI-like enzyme
MPDVTICPATDEDLDDASTLRAAMAREMGHDWDERHPGWRVRFAGFWRDKQAFGAAQVFFAKCDGALVGMVIASVSDEYRGVALGQPRGYINGVFVQPDRRRRGIARELMLAAIGWLREKGCVAVRLRASEDGRALYTTLGFKPGVEMELPL